MITMFAAAFALPPQNEVDIDFDFAPSEVHSLPQDGSAGVPADTVPAFLISSPDGVQQFTPLFYEVRLIESPSGTVVHEAVIDGADALATATDVLVPLAGIPELTPGSFYTAIIETSDATLAESEFSVSDTRADSRDSDGLVLDSATREPGYGTSWLYEVAWTSSLPSGLLRLSDAGGNPVALHAIDDDRAITWWSETPLDEVCLFAEVRNAAGVYSEPQALPCLAVAVLPSRFDSIEDGRRGCSTAPTTAGVGTLMILGLFGTRRRRQPSTVEQ